MTIFSPLRTASLIRTDAFSISGRRLGSPNAAIWGWRKFLAEVISIIPRLIRTCAKRCDILSLLAISDCSDLLGGENIHLLLIGCFAYEKNQMLRDIRTHIFIASHRYNTTILRFYDLSLRLFIPLNATSFY